MRTFKILSIVFTIIFFIQCDNENVDIEPNTSLSLSSNNISLSNSKTYEIIDILDSTGDCYAESSDKTIVQSQVEGKKVIIVGVSTGETTVMVYDNEGGKAEIQVSIDEFNREDTETDIVYVKKGTKRNFKHLYPAELGFILITEQNSKVINSMLLSTDELVLEGIEAGHATLSVFKDYWYYYHYDVRVVEVYPLEIPMKMYSTFSHKPSTFGGPITVGNGGYSVESSNPLIAIATIEPYSTEWSLTNYNFNEASLKIKTFGKPGVATLTITDAAGLTETVSIEVREK